MASVTTLAKVRRVLAPGAVVLGMCGVLWPWVDLFFVQRTTLGSAFDDHATLISIAALLGVVSVPLSVWARPSTTRATAVLTSSLGLLVALLGLASLALFFFLGIAMGLM